ncbi:hypothetical protein R5R35_012316 [Gryllus longicercus]|uniref:Nonsense-mediated mRNA decay factor SMG8 n=1 Tax=Gryllus longicercus TaxID=2509291 RepID=A0AAN9YYR1_9ORTH
MKSLCACEFVTIKMQAFKFPYAPAGKDLILQDRKIVIISVFGKTSFLASGCKSGILDNLIGRQIFQSSLSDHNIFVNDDLMCDIEGYYDRNQQVIFLHLQGVFDISTLVKFCGEEFLKDVDEKGFLPVWAEMKHSYAKALLFLFLVSHILIIHHPTCIFDTSYIYLFRALDTIRLKALPAIGDILRAIPGISKEWVSNGRPCSPRVLFVFNSCPAIFREDLKKSNCDKSSAVTSASSNSSGSSHQNKAPTIKRLEHALEDQIYHILRKSRVITNNSSNSLFAIPANLEFVFVQTKQNPSVDRLTQMANSLIEFCKSPSSDSTNLSNAMNSLALDPAAESNEHSFKDFLQKHIDQAFAKGFDDNVGRHTTPGHFEAPTSNLWYEVANNLYKFCLLQEEKEANSKMLNNLHSLLDVDVKFSEGRCGKVLPLALATYQESLPPHYTRDYHESKLTHALAVFAEHARGPLFDQFATQLEKECDRHWRNGRQMCEVLSLTGNPCTNPLHRGGGEGAGGGELQNEDPDDDPEIEKVDRSQLPVMEHSSGVRYISACNCGRKQGPREDPFTMRAANFDFYKLLSEDCGCAKLENVQFPVFQPSTQDYRAAQLFSKKATSPPVTGPSDNLPQSTESKEIAVSTPQGDTQGFSFGAGFVSSQSGGSDLIQEETNRLTPHPPRETSPTEGQEIIIEVSDSDLDDSKDKSLVRQPSTTEYLPGMLHAESPAGLLPQFPSWSLICLGPSSLYSHNLGLQDQQQAGLLGGSAYLLPWDVTVRLEHHRDRACWPAVGDMFGRNKLNINQHNNVLRGRKTKGSKDSSEFVVKIFVGVEYECPRGHRFMCSAPDKVLKTTGSGLVKDNGNKVTGNDMPLYFPCPCRNAKPLVAQLMRIHVVTPKAPIHVTLNPCVQPAPAPCPIFVTGCDQPLKLSQSAYWVLRLPYVYVGEHGPYIAPKEPVPLNYGRLLAGVYGISEISPDEK